MTDNISLWALVTNASWIVIFVLLMLVCASIFSWIVIIKRGLHLRNAQQFMVDFENQFWSGIDLVNLYKEIETSHNIDNGAQQIFKAGFQEFLRLRESTKLSDPDAVMVGVQRALRVAIAKEQTYLEEYLPFLASVGSTSPYIGLFGTVIGIMNAFRGLAHVQQATLASVAPGIAEALLATAIGLVAAIPAVIAYNRYTAKSDALLANYDTFAEEFSNIIHRKVYSHTD